MVRSIQLILFLFSSTIIFAQNYTVTPETVEVTINLDTVPNTIDVRAPAIITNQTDSTLRIKWERILNDKPDCWETAVFGAIIQAAPQVDSFNFDMAPQSEDYLDVFALISFGTGISHGGEANVILRLTNLDEPTDTLLVNYHFSVAGGATCLSGTQPLTDMHQTVIYPNPVSNNFQLISEIDAYQLDLLGLTGEPLKSWTVQKGLQYDVQDLPAGLYFVQLRDRSGQVMSTRRLVKQ